MIRYPAIVIGLLILAFGLGAKTHGQNASPSLGQPTSEQFAQQLLQSPAAAGLSEVSYSAAQHAASGSSTLSAPVPPTSQLKIVRSGTYRSAQLTARTSQVRTNVLVNDPKEDKFQQDQTTQANPALTLAKGIIVAGFTDTQQSLLTQTYGSNRSGFSYSTDGGKTFKDGGVVPNFDSWQTLPNLGQPSLASDRAGNVYYASLVGYSYGPSIAVAKGTVGPKGVAFNSGTLANQWPCCNGHYGSPERLAVGPDPNSSTTDNLYLAWVDNASSSNECPNGNMQSVVSASSTNGNQSYSMKVLSQYCNQYYNPSDCSRKYYSGSAPVVDSSNGTVYIAAHVQQTQDPNCTYNQPWTQSIEIFSSKDAGQTWGQPLTAMSNLNSSWGIWLDYGKILLSNGNPSLAISATGVLSLAVADRDPTAHQTRVLFSMSGDGGQTWSAPTYISSNTATVTQPSLSTDSAGAFHVAYWEIHSTPSTSRVVDYSLIAGDSPDGINWSSSRLTDKTQFGTVNVPSFDPLSSDTNGSAIANVSVGAHQYFMWTDTRNQVKNFLYPAGRQDPDIYSLAR